MNVQCSECRMLFDDAERSTICPHRRIAPLSVLQRKDAAIKLLGKCVRFANEHGGTSYRVIAIEHDGMIVLDSMAGSFAPHLFKVQEK